MLNHDFVLLWMYENYIKCKSRRINQWIQELLCCTKFWWQACVGEAISDDLKSRRFNVEVGPDIQIPDTADVEVTYEAKWVWDKEYYLSDLVISFKDPDRASMIASGESRHPSLDRKPVDEMVGEILDPIFGTSPQMTK